MFNLMDEARRQAGRALDAAGFGPQEAPFRVVAEWPGARIRAYHPEGVEGPAILILPAPFKRAYIWDLLPEISAVRRCLERNCAVYVLECPVPGSAINLLSASAAPDAFQRQRWTDLFQSLGDARALKIHARVERWTLDEFPIPGQLFEDVVELLYRENLFSRGTLPVGGEVTGVDRIRAPVLAVLNPPGEIVPPASITTALDTAGLEHETLTYEGEPGPALQHVGPLVGPMAHARLWPALLDWIMRQA